MVFYLKTKSFSQGNLVGVDNSADYAEGFIFPRTRYEEKIRLKAIRLGLTREEQMIYLKKEAIKKIKTDTSQRHYVPKLTLWEQIRYPIIKYKKKRLDKILGNYNPYTNDNKRLTPKEKEIIAKKEKGEELTNREQKIYNKAQKKVKKQQKKQSKITQLELTDEEKEIVSKSKKSKESLSKEEKAKLKAIHKKQRQLRRIKEKEMMRKYDSLYWVGEKLPVLPFKYRLRNLLPKFKSSKEKPSTYYRKLNQLYRRYNVTPEENELINKYKAGMSLNSYQRLKARRALVKQSLLKEQITELKRKEYIKFQPRDSQKLLKKAMNKHK